MIKNFLEFLVLGLVLVVMIGIGVVEKIGYFDKLMIFVVNCVLCFLILLIIILIGILGSIVGDVVIIILLLFVVMFFIKIGYYFIVGLMMVYVFVVGGFVVNIVVGM